jgi:superfamily II DNA or RNA helicase
VPNKDLVTQTEADYKHLGLDVGVFYGDRKEYNKTHTICTWQSLEILHKKSKAKEAIDFDIHAFIDGVVCIMVDEVHKAKADVLKQLLSSVFANVPVRWGLTGTIPKDEHEKVACTSTIGPIIGQLSAKELQERGVLANLEVNILQLVDTHVGFSNYAQELKWITTNPERIKFMSDMVNGVKDSGNTLILVDRIATGKLLIEQNPDWVFISGQMKASERKENYDEVKEAEGKVIVATYGVAAVGINIPRIFNLVLVEPGKSFVRVIQSIGRGIRKAKDKDFVNVYDITSTLKYSKKHLTERKKFYKEAQYPFKITKVEYV